MCTCIVCLDLIKLDRPISLLYVPGTVFANVFLARLDPLLSTHCRPSQSGFTRGRSMMDVKIFGAFSQPMNVAFVDMHNPIVYSRYQGWSRFSQTLEVDKTSCVCLYSSVVCDVFALLAHFICCLDLITRF